MIQWIGLPSTDVTMSLAEKEYTFLEHTNTYWYKLCEMCEKPYIKGIVHPKKKKFCH